MRKLWTVVVASGLVAGTAYADQEPGPVAEPAIAPVAEPVIAPCTVPVCQCALVDPGRPRKRTALLVAAGGLALWAGAFTVSIYGSQTYFDARRRVDAGDQSSVKDANDARALVGSYGTGLFVAGTVTVGIATYLYLTARPPENVGQTAVVPTLGGDTVGLAMTGGF